jgi:hypothetical protein
MSVELLGFDNGTQRGAASPVDDVLALSMGVVIGVGGSGIQTVSRVRSAVLAGRPDAAASPSIEFLGVDAVDLSKQNPPLPPGVNLDPRQMYNLTENPFDASEYIRLVGGGATALADWWDMSQQAPVGPLIDGLKQSRMLGRLAFYRESTTLAAKIQSALSRAVRVTQERMKDGNAAGGTAAIAPKVFIVSSSCGGTGSAGLLEVLHKVWVAARALNMTPEIRVFTYLPGVFNDAILTTSSSPVAEAANLQANAYAFFRELDHFITHSDRLHSSVCNPAATPDPHIPAGELVKQVYVVDATLGGAGRLSKVTDAYEIVSETIYQFLMTDAGRPQVAQNGTNTDIYLRSKDTHGYRRIYCGLGIASVTYPGETYRRHLVHRFADWLVREHLVARPIDLQSQVYKDPASSSLIDELRAMHGSVSSYQLPPKALELQMLAETATEVLKDDHGEEIVSRVMSSFTNTMPTAIGQLQAQLRMAKDQALNSLDPTVIDSVLRTGKGVPFGIEMIRRAERATRDLRDEVAEVRATNQNATPRLQKEAEDARRKLRGLMERMLVMPGAREKAAEELGRAVQAWGAAVLAEHRADGEVRFLDAAIARLADMRTELEEAERSLIRQAEGFYKVWRADDLVGKDAGPVDTTALIPADAQPEIEDSRLAVHAFREILAAMQALDMADVIRDLYERWRRSSVGGAVFGLGSGNPDVKKKTQVTFLQQVSALASVHVLQTRDVAVDTEPGAETKRLILPRTLLDAADRADGGASLDHALQSLESLSRKACWAWDAARLGDLADQASPSPATVIVRPKSLTDQVDRYFKTGSGLTVIDGVDEERIVAMTTEWGVSAHALTAVASWQTYYDRAVIAARGDANRQRPHLDRRWDTTLTPLVPSYFDRELVLDLVARVLMGSRLLSDPAVATAVFGPHRGATRAWTLLATEDHGDRIDMTGAIFANDLTTSTWVMRRSLSLGVNYADLIKAVGESAEFRQSSKEFVEAIVRTAGRPAAIQAIQDLLDRTFKPLNQAGHRNTAIAEAIDDLTVALAQLQSDYQQAELMAGSVTLD